MIHYHSVRFNIHRSLVINLYFIPTFQECYKVGLLFDYSAENYKSVLQCILKVSSLIYFCVYQQTQGVFVLNSIWYCQRLELTTEYITTCSQHLLILCIRKNKGQYTENFGNIIKTIKMLDFKFWSEKIYLFSVILFGHF